MQDRVIEAEDDAAVRHLAKCFGHIYAAGIIGAGSGTLPWQAKTVRKCIERCYRDARRELNTETDLLRDGLNILRAKMRALPKANGADLKSVDGFLKGTKPNQATIRAEAFKDWFPDIRQPNVVLKFLREQNALPSRRTPKPGVAIVWAESQPKWPDGTRRRSIVINVQARAVRAAQSVGRPNNYRHGLCGARVAFPASTGRIRFVLRAAGGRRPEAAVTVTSATGASRADGGARLGSAIFVQLGSSVIASRGPRQSTATIAPSTGASGGGNGSLLSCGVS